MELKELSVRGFRRFVDTASVKLDGKLVALVGPNEAGKTSLLRAIALHSSNAALPESEASYFSDDETSIRLSYFISDEDCEAANLPTRAWFSVTKFKGRELKTELSVYPKRDNGLRKKCQLAFERAAQVAAESEDGARVEEFLRDAVAHDSFSLFVDSTLQYDKKCFVQINQFRDGIIGFVDNQDISLQEALHDLSSAITELVEFESSYNPYNDAVSILMRRRPKIFEFTDEYRNLQLPFSLKRYTHQDPKQRQDPSRPLTELMKLVELNLEALINADNQGNRAVRQGLLEEANARLKALCKGRWSQSDAHLKFDLDKSILDILVVNENGFDHKFRYNNFSDRSQGYRQFIALQIFTLINELDGAILLVDEIEQHLHYDAQADLVQMLTREPKVSKVVYATHSAGCLPEDLGSGVKLVKWSSENPRLSTVINRFWANNNDTGFAPLLYGMGAATLSFFPTRNALVAEGATEMLLLPRLLKEAMNCPQLGFQIVHGLSNVCPSSGILRQKAA